MTAGSCHIRSNANALAGLIIVVLFVPAGFPAAALAQAPSEASVRVRAADDGFETAEGVLALGEADPAALTITCGEAGFIPVPGRAAIMVRGGDAAGRPLAGATGTLAIVDGHRAPFVSLADRTFRLDASGTFTTTLTIRKPIEDDAAFLDAVPLAVVLEASLDESTASPPVRSRSDAFPLGLALIRGVTVGPDMESRYNESPPRLMPPTAHILGSNLASGERRTVPEGEFFVLARIPASGEYPKIRDVFHLYWAEGARGRLDIPLKGELKAGTVLEMGKVDLLTPLEHEARVKGYVREFIEAMPLTPAARGGLLGDLDRLRFAEGYTGTVPNYSMTEFDPPERIQIPGTRRDYWDANPYLVASPLHDADPAYAILFHEMGHFIHTRLVEAAKLKLFYNLLKGMGSKHTTWKPPENTSDLAQRVASFNEATADFFAFLMFHFLKTRHPEFKESVYYDRGYLTDFDTDERARTLAHSGGCRIEGIQTTFLKSLYGSGIAFGAPLVFGDYLRVMLAKKDDAWFAQWVPARTMREWIVLKEKHGSPASGAVLETARRFNIVPCTDQPEISIMPRTAAGGVFTVNGRAVTAAGTATLHALLPGEEIQVVKNSFLVMMADTERGELVQLSVPEGTAFRFNSPTEVQVLQGLMGVSGRITVVTPAGSFTSEGTLWTVEVREGGSVKVQVLEGRVRAKTARSETVFTAGKAATVLASGVMETPFDPASSPARSLFDLPAPEPLFDDPALFAAPAAAVPAFEPPSPVPAGRPTAAPVPPSQPPPPPQQFIALNRPAPGGCLVVVGVEGIRPGDVVYGTFASYEEARGELDRQCRASAAAPAAGETPPSAAVPSPPPPSSATAPTARPEEVAEGWVMVPASPGTAFTIPATAMPLKDMCSRNGTPPVQTVFLRAGQMVALRAEGAVQAGGAFPKVGPAGQGSYPMNKPCMPIQGLPLMRLLGQFNGTVFDAGVTGVTFTAPADGWLHFGFNDDLFHDNTGTLDLTITGDFQPGAAAAASPTDIESAASPSLVCPILALPKYDNDDSTKGIFFINLDTGNAFFIDRVKRDPLSVRTRTMNQNIFAALDRTPGTPAGPGQVLAGEIRDGSGNVTALLLVDSTTGAMAYYADLKSQSYRGTVRKIAGNLAAALAAPDGNFALLMQRASSGETQGAYLYHAATGRALYFPKMGNLPSTPAASSVTSLPRMEGTVSALDLQAGNEATEAFLLADNAAGVLYHVGGVERRPDQLTVTRYPINLFDHFPHQAAVKTPRRFVPVPLFNGSGATQDVLILDTGTGAMAVLKGALQPRKAKVQPVRKNLYDHLPAGVGRPRVWTAVPKVAGNGATEGAWIFDSATGEVLYLDSIDDPSGLAVRRVDQRTR